MHNRYVFLGSIIPLSLVINHADSNGAYQITSGGGFMDFMVSLEPRNVGPASADLANVYKQIKTYWIRLTRSSYFVQR